MADGDTWELTRLYVPGRTGLSVNMDTDSMGYHHIVHYCNDSGRRGIYHTYQDETGWHTEFVTNANQLYTLCCICVDSNDNLHVAYGYYIYDQLWYATNASGSWVHTMVDSVSLGHSLSIDVDSNNYPRIAYRNRYLSYWVREARYNGSWTVSDIANAGSYRMYETIKIDSEDKSIIAYTDNNNANIRVAIETESGWVLENTNSPANTDDHMYMDLDSNDYPHITCVHTIGHSLYYIHKNELGWSSEVIDGGAIDDDTSIAIGNNDIAHIAYYYCSDRTELRYVTNISGAWVIESVEDDYDVGLYCSINVDTSDNVAIAYYDDYYTDLWYAYKKGVSPKVGGVLPCPLELL